MKALAILFTAALAGCASYTAVTPTGADTFMVAGTGGSSSSHEVVARLYRDASANCEAQGKALKAIKMEDRPGNFGRRGSAKLEFTCVPRQ